jgi:2-dehydro-3-deoxyphosphogluconate aldolase / (4S)-4-hydroxy-2-oxoglutarate aldolase
VVDAFERAWYRRGRHGAKEENNVNSAVATRWTRPSVPEAISGSRVIAIGRRLEPSAVPSIGAALASGGIRAFEVTMDSESALEAIRALTKRFAPDELLLGAGTVLTLAAAQEAVEAGARFIVMPHLDTAIVEWAAERGIAAFPGCLTPTEILTAWRSGAAAVKVFPASAVGPAFVRELRGPMAEIPLVPTGGVTLENAAEFIVAGAVAVGMGSWLTGSGDPAVVRERAAAITRSLAEAGNRH